MKTWGNLLEEKRDEIFDLCKECIYKSLSNCLQGWSFDVVLDSDGTAEIVGPRNNSQSEREWKGLARAVFGDTYDGYFGDGSPEDSEMAWLDEKIDPEFSEWVKAHETDEENGKYSGWIWGNDNELHERFFDEDLPDKLYNIAARRSVYDSDATYEMINGRLKSLKKDWDEDELPKE